MLEILGIKVTYETLAWLIAFIVSEVIGASKLRSNGVVQLILNVIGALKPARKEDEVANAILEEIQELKDRIDELKERN